MIFMQDTECCYNDKMIIRADYSELEELREFIREKAVSYGFPDNVAYNIALAVDEACTNLIRYTFKDDNTQKICIHIDTDDEEFTVEITDKGSPFNPETVPPVDMVQYRSSYKKGGLGIHIMRSVMDEIIYQPSTKKNPINILKLKKVLV